MKVFSAILVIIGTVIGSGFMSGKEIVVFFSRFGVFSFPCIVIAFFLFWLLFNFFLKNGDKADEKLKNSKFSNVINFLICTILSSAMIAGCTELLSPLPALIRFFVLGVILFFCFFIIKKGLGGLEKANFLLVPVMVIVLIIGLICATNFSNMQISMSTSFSSWGVFYCLLYVLLNTSNSCIVLAKLGKGLNKSQKARVSFLSALALFVILLFANLVLLQNKDVFSQDMPLLSLFDRPWSIVMQAMILLGCVTTLFSLVFASSGSVRGLCRNNFFIGVTSVILPLAISAGGFGNIVSLLYPLTSVLAVFLLCDLFFIPFFKRAYTKIHSARKDTK